MTAHRYGRRFIDRLATFREDAFEARIALSAGLSVVTRCRSITRKQEGGQARQLAK
jgi:hypothetical protein